MPRAMPVELPARGSATPPARRSSARAEPVAAIMPRRDRSNRARADRDRWRRGRARARERAADAELRARVEELRASRGADRPSGGRGAPAARARPARRRPAAAGRAGAQPAAGAREARQRPRGREASCSRRPPPSSARRPTELRELARGIHPAVLTDRGLRPALEALAGRAPCRSSSTEPPAERLPAAGRGRRLLRRRRGAHQRRRATPGDTRAR